MVVTTPLYSLAAILASLAPSILARPVELQPAHAPSPDYHRPRRSIDLDLSSAATTSASQYITSATTYLDVSTVRMAASNSLLLGQYVPSWESSAASDIKWDYAGLAWWFVLETTSEGFSLEDQSLDAMAAFVEDAHARNKTALVTCGGWTGSRYFSSLVATSASRESFASRLVTFVDSIGFDGLDIDWEYPGTAGADGNEISSADVANYLLFLQSLRAKLGSRLLTAAMPSAGLTGADGDYLTDTSAYAAVLDFITVMAYDNYGSGYSGTTGPNAPLATCITDGPSDEAQIQAWIASGFPAAQILLGVPSYSHLFKTASATLATMTYNGHSTQSFQALASFQPTDPESTYSELIALGYLSSDGTEGLGSWVRSFDNCTKTPSLFNSQTQHWISYEDGESAALKAAYATSMGLAGVGLYDSTGYPAHVLHKIRTALGGSVSSDSKVASRVATMVASSGTGSASSSGNYVDGSIYLTSPSTEIASVSVANASTTRTAASSSSTSTREMDISLVQDKSTSEASSSRAAASESSAATRSARASTSAASTADTESAMPAGASSSSSESMFKLEPILALSSSTAASSVSTGGPAPSSPSSTQADPSTSSSSTASAHARVANAAATSAYSAASSQAPSSSSPSHTALTSDSTTATTVTTDQSGVYTVPAGYVIVADMRTASSSLSPSSAPNLAARSWSSRPRAKRDEPVAHQE